jgi:hypothetical protein
MAGRICKITVSPSKDMWNNAAQFPQKACRTQRGRKNKKKGGKADIRDARDLLSRANVDVLGIQQTGPFEKKCAADSFNVECHMCAAVTVYQISFNVKRRNQVVEHQLVSI